MGLFSRAFRNIRRVVRDVAPIAAAIAPIALGVGAGALISQVLAPQAAQIPAATRAQVARTRCPASGAQGRGFSAPFQSANFTTGGSLPGRSAAVFQRRLAVGRDVRRRVFRPRFRRALSFRSTRRFTVPGRF